MFSDKTSASLIDLTPKSKPLIKQHRCPTGIGTLGECFENDLMGGYGLCQLPASQVQRSDCLFIQVIRPLSCVGNISDNKSSRYWLKLSLYRQDPRPSREVIWTASAASAASVHQCILSNSTSAATVHQQHPRISTSAASAFQQHQLHALEGISANIHKFRSYQPIYIDTTRHAPDTM